VSWLPPQECTIVKLLNDGTPVIRITKDKLQEVPIHGVEVPQSPSHLYVDILTQRIRPNSIRLQCELADDGRRTGRYSYRAWQDKTGDVWRHLAWLLIDQGAARVASGDFPERYEYLQAEETARRERRGLWSQQADSPPRGAPSD
jgi:hypothetical protein